MSILTAARKKREASKITISGRPCLIECSCIQYSPFLWYRIAVQYGATLISCKSCLLGQYSAFQAALKSCVLNFGISSCGSNYSFLVLPLLKGLLLAQQHVSKSENTAEQHHGRRPVDIRSYIFPFKMPLASVLESVKSCTATEPEMPRYTIQLGLIPWQWCLNLLIDHCCHLRDETRRKDPWNQIQKQLRHQFLLNCSSLIPSICTSKQLLQ